MIVFNETSCVPVISLGAGVQSSTMALMAACGEITPMPLAAIFADTQAEPASVYRWLDWLEKQLPFPVARVSKGSLREGMLKVRTSRKSGLTYEKHSIPAHIEHPTRGNGILGRHCTLSYKITPITQWLRQYKKQTVSLWIGISVDESDRMKPNRESWIRNRWPLIEKDMTRQDCLDWMKSHGYPMPPRSSCIFCPYHNDAEWHQMKTEDVEAWEEAIATEIALQETIRQIPQIEGVPYLHASRQPLPTVELKPRSRERQIQRNLFRNECEGMCGV
jgi:3'-phosphoadenosine 5'-phosphosulfate sulfotransferase (PAPS reductase)/FAD synthetase